MKKVYVTITGMKYYYGFNPFSIGKKLTCKKEHNNPYDSEAIKVTMKNIGTVGYIANSPYTKVRVMFMTSTKIICEVIDGFKDKYSEETTEPTDKIEEKEVVEF